MMVPRKAPRASIRSAVMKIATDSTPLEAPKTPEGSTPYELYRLVASTDKAQEMASRLRAGGYGWGHAKQALFEALDATFAAKRERFHSLRADEAQLDRILAAGADRAREIARRTMARVRKAVGVG